MNKLLFSLAALLTVPAPAQVLTNNVQPGHVVYGKHGGYTCQPIGATCEVPQSPDIRVKTPHTAKTDWPKVASVQLVLDSVQAKYPGNEHVKPCGPDNHEDGCWDSSLRHIVNHLYGKSKERCEHDEGVSCEELQPCVVDKYQTYEQCRQWVPIGKPVFEDKTPEPDLNIILPNMAKSLEPTWWTNIHGYTPNGGTLADMGRVTASGKLVVAENFVGNVSVESKAGRVERLTPVEYAALKKLRQDVSDLEFQIAVAHDIDLGYDPCKAAQTPGAAGYQEGSLGCYADIPRPADRYEFRGQFLLINVPEPKK